MLMPTYTPYTEYNIGKFYLEIIPNTTSMLLGTLQSLYYATLYNMVLVITQPDFGSQMVIFL